MRLQLDQITPLVEPGGAQQIRGAFVTGGQLTWQRPVEARADVELSQALIGRHCVMRHRGRRRRQHPEYGRASHCRPD